MTLYKKQNMAFDAAMASIRGHLLMDINLPAAINRVDLLWNEMGKLIRKG